MDGGSAIPWLVGSVMVGRSIMPWLVFSTKVGGSTIPYGWREYYTMAGGGIAEVPYHG